jgi:GT2 family glycosyltransferase
MQRHLGSVAYEWIVADNQSEQDLSAQLTDCRYVRLSKNFGFGTACNRAAEKSEAPVLFFVNPDCELVNDCVTPLLACLKEAEVVGPKVLNPNGTIQLSFGPFLSLMNEAIQRRHMHNESTLQGQQWLKQKTASRFYPDYVSGCALMIRTELFRKIGGFDEDFFLYEEDVDLCKRLKEQGYRVLYEPAAQIVHFRNAAISKNPQAARDAYRRSQRLYYQKHGGFVQLQLLRLYQSLTR